jgi:hypothetical protein
VALQRRPEAPNTPCASTSNLKRKADPLVGGVSVVASMSIANSQVTRTQAEQILPFHVLRGEFRHIKVAAASFRRAMLFDSGITTKDSTHRFGRLLLALCPFIYPLRSTGRSKCFSMSSCRIWKREIARTGTWSHEQSDPGEDLTPVLWYACSTTREIEKRS